MNKRFKKGALFAALTMTAVMGLSGCNGINPVSQTENSGKTTKQSSVVSEKESSAESSQESTESTLESSDESSQESAESILESSAESSQESSVVSDNEFVSSSDGESSQVSEVSQEESYYDPAENSMLIFGVYGPPPAEETDDQSNSIENENTFDMSDYTGEFQGKSNDYNGQGFIRITEISDGRYSIESEIAYNNGLRISCLNYTTEITSDTVTFTTEDSFMSTFTYTLIFKDGYIDFSRILVARSPGMHWGAPEENHMIFTKS